MARATPKAVVKMPGGGKAIVVGTARPDAYSRQYGSQVILCHVGKRSQRRPVVLKATALGLRVVGRVKRIPTVCAVAYDEYRGRRFQR